MKDGFEIPDEFWYAGLFVGLGIGLARHSPAPGLFNAAAAVVACALVGALGAYALGFVICLLVPSLRRPHLRQ